MNTNLNPTQAPSMVARTTPHESPRTRRKAALSALASKINKRNQEKNDEKLARRLTFELRKDPRITEAFANQKFGDGKTNPYDRDYSGYSG